jgi:hypothetical protein
MDNINISTGKKPYYKDSKEAMAKRSARFNPQRMFVNGKYISNSHPLHKAGHYKSFGDAAFAALEKGIKIKEGYVYAIVNAAWPEWVKIGKAIDAEDRLNGYQTSSPMRDYKLIHSVYFDDRNVAELKAHAIAQGMAPRKNEWFKMTEEQALEVLGKVANG